MPSLLELMLEKRMVALMLHVFHDESEGFVVALHRHSSTWTRVTFTSCLRLESLTIATILHSCPALGAFNVTMESPKDNAVTLNDAVAVPWATNRIRWLRLAVYLGELDELKNSIYSRPAPFVLRKKRQQGWSYLKRFTAKSEP